MAETPDRKNVSASTEPYKAAQRPAQAQMSETRWLAVAELQVDYSYQHRPYPHAIEDLKNEFAVEHCGFILVNVRPDRTTWIIDGQTRHAVHELLGFRWIKAEILRGLTQAEEAEVYLLKCVNTQRQPVDFFLAEYTAARPMAVLIHDILTKRGIDIESYAARQRRRTVDMPPVITCISHLKRMIQKDPTGDALKMALDLIDDTWGYSAATITGLFLSAMHKLMQEHASDLDRKTFITKLGAHRPAELRAQATQLRNATKPQLNVYVALQRAMIALYNSGRPQHRRIALGS